MPLRIVLHAEFDLSDLWGTKEDWEDMGSLKPDGTFDLDSLAELLDEDWSAVLEEAGGQMYGDTFTMRALLKSAVWVDE